ncbi:hypothetical protein V8F33_008374 [Rhypophila sp. PSN 637]
MPGSAFLVLGFVKGSPALPLWFWWLFRQTTGPLQLRENSLQTPNSKTYELCPYFVPFFYRYCFPSGHIVARSTSLIRTIELVLSGWASLSRDACDTYRTLDGGPVLWEGDFVEPERPSTRPPTHPPDRTVIELRQS